MIVQHGLPQHRYGSRRTVKVGIIALGALIYAFPWILIFGRLYGTPLGVDFGMLRSASLAALSLHNPYTTGPGFYNAPWMLLVVAPFAILPRAPGFVLWTLIGAAAYVWAFRRMHLDWAAVYLLLLSPLAVGNLVFGNYDWLILAAATIPPAWGIWFLALKPQLGVVLAGLWTWQSLRSGLRAAVLVVVPLGIALLISFLLGYRLPDNSRMAWSADLWPWGIPIGAVLAFLAFRRQDPLLALAAAPFLSPYVVWHSWIAVLLPMARHRWVLSGGILASWILFWWAFNRI